MIYIRTIIIKRSHIKLIMCVIKYSNFVIIYIIGTNKNSSVYIRIQKGVNNKIVTIPISNNII